MENMERLQYNYIPSVPVHLHEWGSLRSGGRKEILDLKNIKRVIVVGSSCSGKSTLQRNLLKASRLDPDLVDRISIPSRVVTRSRRPDDGEEITHASQEIFDDLVVRDKLGLYGIKYMEDKRLERYGYTQPKEGALPIFFANNGVVKNPENVQPTGILDDALIIAVFAPDEVRRERFTRRSPELVGNNEYIFRFSEEESSNKLIDKADLVIDNFGQHEADSTTDLINLIKLILRVKHK